MKIWSSHEGKEGFEFYEVIYGNCKASTWFYSSTGVYTGFIRVVWARVVSIFRFSLGGSVILALGVRLLGGDDENALVLRCRLLSLWAERVLTIDLLRPLRLKSLLFSV